ncbi:Histone-lysine N-methyltransferase SETMAR [Anthophora plagiata]
MCIGKVHLWRCILYKFQQGRNTTEACKTLANIFGEHTISDRTCRRWFEKFEAGDFDLKDKPCSERLFLNDDDMVKTIIQQDPFSIISEIADILNSR